MASEELEWNNGTSQELMAAEYTFHMNADDGETNGDGDTDDDEGFSEVENEADNHLPIRIIVRCHLHKHRALMR